MSKLMMAGEPSMDEILASIRKIIAEEPMAPRTNADILAHSTMPPNLPSLEPRPANGLNAPSAAALSVAEHGGFDFQRSSSGNLSTLVDQLTHTPAAFDDGRRAPSPSLSPMAAPVAASPGSSALEFQRTPLPPLFGEVSRARSSDPSAADRIRPMDIGQLRPTRTEPDVMLPELQMLAPMPATISNVAVSTDPAKGPELLGLALPIDTADAVVSPSIEALTPAPNAGDASTTESVFGALIAGLTAGRSREPAPVEAPVRMIEKVPAAELSVTRQDAVVASQAVPAIVSPSPVTVSDPISVGAAQQVTAKEAAQPSMLETAPASVHVSNEPPAVTAPTVAAAPAAQRAPSKPETEFEPYFIDQSKAPIAIGGTDVASAVASPASTGVTPLSNTVATAVTTPNRTFEDAVAEMLRPMLRQWLDSNMPKLVEKALASEIAAVAHSTDVKKPDHS